MFDEIGVALESGGATPRFRLSSRSGGAPRVTVVVVTDVSTEEPIWWLLPESFTSVHAFTIDEVDEAAVESLAGMNEVDPLEDLPPSDPRHQRALSERQQLETAVLVPLPALSYAEVPPGFRQARPSDGPAPALVPGREYCLMVMGAGDTGYFSFKA